MQESVTLRDLGRLLRERRKRDEVSLRQAATEIGISFNSLARIERGQPPDVATFQRLAEWLAIPPSAFFAEGRRAATPTPTAIAAHLSADPALTEEAAERIAAIVEELYSALARRQTAAAFHLRAARTMRADAAVILADLIQNMQQALEKRRGAG